MRLGDLDVLKEMLIKERDAIPLTRTERYGFGVGLPNHHGESMRGGINKAFKCMEKVPTIDAVPVVRCKDCKRRGELGCPMYYEEYIEWDDDGYRECDVISNDHTFDDGFCYRGERKDGDS